MEGETRELRFVFLEIFALEDPLFSSARQTFVTEIDKWYIIELYDNLYRVLFIKTVNNQEQKYC